MQINQSLFKLYKLPIFLSVLSFILYAYFAYDLLRTDSVKLLGLYIGLFILFVALIKFNGDRIKFFTLISFLFRAVFLLSIPNLSQDFYRFIWDGRMILEGWNPYLATPEFFISKSEFPISQSQELYDGMGKLSAGHYTNYPPLNQICFLIAGLFAGKSILGSVVVMRLLIIAADFGTLFYGKKLLNNLNISNYHIFWYLLNPFIIIELTGNLHFEGVMIFFLVWSLYLLQKGKWRQAAIVLACSISVKLIPLIFLPLFYHWFTNKEFSSEFGISRLLSFYAIIAVITLLLFLPFYSSEFISNYAETVGLWFQKFEFNASIYYIAREIGYTFSGYNEIAIIGKIIPIVVILYVLIISFFRKNKSTTQLITAMLMVLSFYYFTSTTVHPWYIATLLVLSLFTRYRFPLVWSLVIMLSYLSYGNSETKENLWIIGLEYTIVYGVFLWEIIRFKRVKTLS